MEVTSLRKYFRMYPGNEVRLMHAYFVTCTGYDVKMRTVTLRCAYAPYDPAIQRRKQPWDGRKVSGTIHWVCS